MQRLIDANALDKAFTELRFNADGELAHWGDRKDWCLHGSEIEKLIADAPTVDAEPVVRCKDCKECEERHTANYLPFLYCKLHENSVSHDAFCCWGERREE